MRNRQRGACKDREKGGEGKKKSKPPLGREMKPHWRPSALRVRAWWISLQRPSDAAPPGGSPPSRCQHLKVESVLILYAELLHHCLGTLPKPFHTVLYVQFKSSLHPPLNPPTISSFIPTIREPKPASCVTSPSLPSTSLFTPTARKHSPTRMEMLGPCSCLPPEPWQVANIWRGPTSLTQTCHIFLLSEKTHTLWRRWVKHTVTAKLAY